jgi:AsmA protein
MFRPSKPVVLIASGLVVLVALAASVAALVLRANAKPRLEAVASAALEMDVDVEGRFAVGFFPRLHVSLNDVRARKRGVEIASADEIEVGIGLLPLLRNEVRIHTIALKRLKIFIERDHDGRLNVSRSSETGGPRPALAASKISMSDATLLYTNRQTGREIAAVDCRMDASRLQFSPGDGPGAPTVLSVAGELACARLQTTGVTASDLQLSFDGEGGIIDLAPVTMRLLGGQGSGSVHVDYSGLVPVYRVDYRLRQFGIDEFLEFLSPEQGGRRKVGEGSMDFSTTLTLQGKTVNALKQSASGKASMHGGNLKLEIGDLDHKFSRYEASQSFNLVDVGAVFFAGPLALGVTKGYDFARVFEGSDGSTMIHVLVSNWRVERGVAHATDAAMTTARNRVALKGALDFVNGRYDDVTVALVDAGGCARAKQKIRGPFSRPVVEKPDIVSTVSGPARTLFRQAKGLIGGKCEVFYSGSVEPPV